MATVAVPKRTLDVGDLGKCEPDVHASVKRCMEAACIEGTARFRLKTTIGRSMYFCGLA